MYAVEISRPGGPEVLTLTQRPIPEAGAGEVLIAVAAAGVNGHDLHHRHDGSHPIHPGESDLPGLEAAGVVQEVGHGVTELAVGDRVCALLRGGGYAEYVAAKAASCLPVPAGLSFVEAASLPEACFTVWSNVFTEGGLQAGQRFLMNGGTSGIGMAAIQIASRLGAEVYATASGAEKARLCQDLGATLGIDHTAGDFVDLIRAATSGEGVDFILDIIAGDFIPKDLQILRMDGRLAVIGAARGAHADVDLAQIVRKRLVLTGSTLRPRPEAYKAKVAAELRARVWPLIEAGEIRPIVHSVFELADASAAHALMERRGHVGKVILKVRGAMEP